MIFIISSISSKSMSQKYSNFLGDTTGEILELFGANCKMTDSEIDEHFEKLSKQKIKIELVNVETQTKLNKLIFVRNKKE